MEFAPGFAIASDLRLAFSAAIVALVAAALMLLTTLALRVAGRAASAVRRRSREAWRLRFAAALSGDAIAARPVRRRDSRVVMLLFEHIVLSVRGEGIDRLAAFARKCGLARWALAALHHRRLADRLLAVSVLGHLGHAEAFHELSQLARDPDPGLSISAARALLRLNPGRVAGLVVDLARRRPDWPSVRVIAALRETESASVWNVLHRALKESPAEDLPRLLELLAALPLDVASQLARPVLARTSRPVVIVACLRFMADPRDTPTVRALLSHADPRVRLAAVQGLARLASPEDLPRFTHALSDHAWAVRQAAADALAALPFVDRAWLERLRASVSDRYAAEALGRAIAERR
jgi:HEAT repeat protein